MMTNAGRIHYAWRRPTESNCTNSSFVIHSMPRRPRVDASALLLITCWAQADVTWACGHQRMSCTLPPVSVPPRSVHFPLLPSACLSISVSSVYLSIPLFCLCILSIMVVSTRSYVRCWVSCYCSLFLPVWLWEGYSVSQFPHMKIGVIMPTHGVGIHIKRNY